MEAAARRVFEKKADDYEFGRRKTFPKVPQLDGILHQALARHKGQLSIEISFIRPDGHVERGSWCRLCWKCANKFDRQQVVEVQTAIRMGFYARVREDFSSFPVAVEALKKGDTAYTKKEFRQHAEGCEAF